MVREFRFHVRGGEISRDVSQHCLILIFCRPPKKEKVAVFRKLKSFQVFTIFSNQPLKNG
jgi:hypothetical protein